MTKISQPEITAIIANANVAVENTAQKVLFVGQQVAAASAADGALTINIGNENEEDALFGVNSQLAGDIRAFRKINKLTRVDAIGLVDAAGTARLVNCTFTGTSTAAGTITVRVGSQENHEFIVAIPSSTAASAVPALIATAVNADLDCPYTAADETVGVLGFTADNDGTVANDDGFEVIIETAGLTLSADVTETTPGATDPTLTAVLTSVVTERYQGINWPYRATTELAALLGPRFNATNAILDGVGFVSAVDTLANITDGSTGVLDVLNDQSIVYLVDQLETEASGTAAKESYLGPAQLEFGHVKTAYFLAIRALRFTTDENIASFVTTSASKDQIGGIATASLPYFNTPVAQLPLIKQGRGWTATEIGTIADAGGTVFGVNSGGTSGLVGEVYTTYKTDSASNPDPTWEFLNYVDTQVNIREYRFNNAKARFGQSRLTEGGVARNRDMANKAVIRQFFEQLFQDTGGDDFVLTQSGDTAVAFYKANLTVSLDLSTGTVTVTDLTPIVTQLRKIVMTMKVTFTL